MSAILELKKAIANRLLELIVQTIIAMDIPSRIPKEFSLEHSWEVREDGEDIIVGSTLSYAPFVEFGRFPGKMPPEQPLIEWVIAKLGVSPNDARRVAYNVRRKIAEEGIAPKNFVLATLNEFSV